MQAQKEARRLGRNYVGAEHIFLGLLSSGGIAQAALKDRGVTLKNAREQAEKFGGRGNGLLAVEIPFTPRAKKLLEFAHAEAKASGHEHVDTEHLLLGTLREAAESDHSGITSKTLEALNVDANALRSKVIKLMEKAQK